MAAGGGKKDTMAKGDHCLVHATSVAMFGYAILLVGRSGVGKSDLALRLIDRGAILIADDYTLLSQSGGHLIARCPDTIRGLLEVRGIGLIELPFVDRAEAVLQVSLSTSGVAPIAPTDLTASLPTIALDPTNESAPVKVEMAARAALDGVRVFPTVE